MNNRKITNPLNVKFEPFDNYGTPIPGMSWHKISYNKETGQGSYILKMEPGAKSLPHKHTNYEEEVTVPIKKQLFDGFTPTFFRRLSGSVLG